MVIEVNVLVDQIVRLLKRPDPLLARVKLCSQKGFLQNEKLSQLKETTEEKFTELTKSTEENLEKMRVSKVLRFFLVEQGENPIV